MDRNELRKNQLSGAAIGAIIGLMTANFWPPLRVMPGLLGWLPPILWGAVIGAVLSSVVPLARFAQRFTHSENALLNNAVGLIIPFAVVVFCGLLWRLVSIAAGG